MTIPQFEKEAFKLIEKKFIDFELRTTKRTCSSLNKRPSKNQIEQRKYTNKLPRYEMDIYFSKVGDKENDFNFFSLNTSNRLDKVMGLDFLLERLKVELQLFPDLETKTT